MKPTTTIEQLNAYYGKVPPQAIDVEEAVLGALMIESEAFLKVSGLISSQSFYKQEHVIIFETISKIYLSGKPIDLLVVTQELKNSGKLDEVGGPLYITQLTNKIASAAHIEHHARIICQKHIQRQLILLSSQLSEKGYDECEDVWDTITWLHEQLNDIENLGLSADSGHSQSDVCQSAIKELEADCELSKLGKLPGINTGFSILNSSMGGWRNGDFTILAARPGVGKTSLALHFAIKAAQCGIWVNFYSLEMMKERLFRTILSSESGVNRKSIRDGRLCESDWDMINNSIGPIEKLPILWYDKSISAQQIASNTRKNRKNGKCGIVIIDYLQLLTPPKNANNREQEIAQTSRTLKSITLNEGIPLIGLSQLNREVSDGKPNLKNLRESGSLEQDSDNVIFAWRDISELSTQEIAQGKLGKYMITAEKQRNGGVGSFEIWASEEMNRFGDMHKDSGNNYPVRSVNFSESQNNADNSFNDNTPF